MHEGIPANEGAADAGIVGGWAQDGDGESGGVHLLGARAQEPDGGLGIEDGALAREALGQGHVVGVEAGHERRPGHPERAIERARQPLTVARALDAETQVAHGGEEIGRRVIGGIVDHDELEVGRRLGQHAHHRLPDPGRAVVDAHEHGHRGGRHRGA